MSDSLELIQKLTKLLYPTGRAHHIPKGGDKEKMHDGLAEGEARALDDGLAILDHILPDNPNFGADDAAIWEKRLGLIVNPLASLDDRKAAIIRKMNHPGDIPARQSWDYVQASLQAAGFNVYVHENIPEQTPYGILSSLNSFGSMGNAQSRMGITRMGSVVSYYPGLFIVSRMGLIRMGAPRMGGVQYSNLVVNHIEESLDAFFNIGSNYRSTFFIGGVNLGDFADVPLVRKAEFRQLILKLKPVQGVGILFVNYI